MRFIAFAPAQAGPLLYSSKKHKSFQTTHPSNTPCACLPRRVFSPQTAQNSSASAVTPASSCVPLSDTLRYSCQPNPRRALFVFPFAALCFQRPASSCVPLSDTLRHSRPLRRLTSSPAPLAHLLFFLLPIPPQKKRISTRRRAQKTLHYLHFSLEKAAPPAYLRHIKRKRSGKRWKICL